MSGPAKVRHFVTALFHLLFIIMKSIMFFVLPSGDSHVHFLLAFLWENAVFITCMLLFRQKFKSLSPLPFSSPYPCFPSAPLHVLQSFPTFALKSPITIV